jgi:membrane protein
MVVGVGFLLLVSLLVSAALSALGGLMRSSVPETAAILMGVLDFVLSQAIITFMLAALYSILPDAKVPWRIAWFGGGITALLFVVGKSLIGLYLGRSAPGSAFGAAGSLAVVLIWIYYSSIVFYSGAEITKVYARRRGNHLRPEEFAVKAEPKPATGP